MPAARRSSVNASAVPSGRNRATSRHSPISAASCTTCGKAGRGLDAFVDAGSRTLAWHGEAGAIVDVVAFEAAADRGLEGDRAALQEAAGLYKGDLLPECAGAGQRDEYCDGDRAQ